MTLTPDNHVRVVARAIAKSDHVSQVKVIVKALMEHSQQESGCLQYDVLQNRDEPTDFTTIEEWSDQGFLDAHFQTPHFQTAIAQLNGLLESESDIRFYQPIS
jgi:quinol monooxygenase YgiN